MLNKIIKIVKNKYHKRTKAKLKKKSENSKCVNFDVFDRSIIKSFKVDKTNALKIDSR